MSSKVLVVVVGGGHKQLPISSVNGPLREVHGGYFVNQLGKYPYVFKYEGVHPRQAAASATFTRAQEQRNSLN